MRNLSNGIAGVTGLMVLLGALAATPNTIYGKNETTQGIAVAEPDLGSCQILQVEEGNKVSSVLYAEGVQIYRWDGASWTFVVPEAVLFADAGGNGEVGTHYGGPTWESASGSKVVGRVVDRCTPDPSAIAWLLLEAVYTEGPGMFDRVTFIQRVNTVGGLAPTDPGAFPGEVKRVPYTAEYVFYRAHR